MEQGSIEELLQKAEKLRSELGGSQDMPRIERNLKQLEAVGKELWSRTAYNTSRDSCDIRASVLLGSKGYDLQKVSQHLESLSTNKKLPIIEHPKDSYDVQSFLKYERENAVLSVIEEVKKSTFELVDNNYWDYMNKDWNEYKSKLLNLFVNAEEFEQSAIVDNRNLDETLKRLNASIRTPQQIGKSIDEHELHDIECIINQILTDKNRTNYDEDVNFIYNLRDHHNRTIELLNSHLGSLVAERKVEGSKRERIELFTIKLAEKLCNEGNTAEKETIGVFYLLLDLMTFFDYYHSKLYNDALDTIVRLNILPFRNVDIKLKINQFAQLSEEIRRNIPEILIATMNILYHQYKEARANASQPISKFGLINENSNEEKLCNEIRQKGKTLITYAGMVNYRMPGDTSAKLVQLEVLMN